MRCFVEKSTTHQQARRAGSPRPGRTRLTEGSDSNSIRRVWYSHEWPAGGLTQTLRKGDEIVEALPEDIAVGKSYPEVRDKGMVVGGKRITILTKKNRYRPNEEVRVIHVMEAVDPGHKIRAMGPKPIYGEYIDGKLVTPEKAPDQIYEGLILDSPDVDYNYDITSYRFPEPGRHRIHWEIDGLRSNPLDLEITAA